MPVAATGSGTSSLDRPSTAIVATAAATVATIAVLGRSRDEEPEPVAAPGKLVVSAPPGDRELGPVASVR